MFRLWLLLTDSDGFELLQQFDVRVGLHSRLREVVSAAAVLQKSEVEEDSELVGSGYTGIHIFSHVCVE